MKTATHSLDRKKTDRLMLCAYMLIECFYEINCTTIREMPHFPGIIRNGIFSYFSK